MKSYSSSWLAAILLSATSSASFGQQVNYNVNVTDNTGTGITVNGPTNGSYVAPSFINAGAGNGGTGTVSITSNINPITSGGSVCYTYDFDQVLDGGSINLSSFLQYGDWQIDLVGGNGTLTSTNIGFGTSGNLFGVPGVDYDVSGLGSSSVFLDNMSNTAGGFDGNFAINGSYSALVLCQLDNPDNPLNIVDPFAYLTVSGSTIVPEPSSSLLVLLCAACLVVRRKVSKS